MDGYDWLWNYKFEPQDEEEEFDEVAADDERAMRDLE